MAALPVSAPSAPSLLARLQLLAGFALAGSILAGCLLSVALLTGARIEGHAAEVLHGAGAGLGFCLGAAAMMRRPRPAHSSAAPRAEHGR